jgi:alkanesulfonate monooxygenase SsuD/methylene tetrahydromethanopterin reductase-like flavin-dependent oxidoreductase (luciferase family)
MKFGYFTLSDNHYVDNPRSANQYINDIVDEAIFAETVGLHSAWLGEHHFSTLGVLSCPDLALAYIAARTTRLRLAPAVTVLPLHHPIRVAEQWATLDLLSGGRVDFAAGRGYDRREYGPLDANFEENQAVFAEGMEIVLRLWRDGKISHSGKYYRFEDIGITPQPVQRPIPTYVAAFSRPSIELAAKLGCGVIVAPFAAVLTFGGLKQVADTYAEACARAGTKPGRLMCSYFIHFADDAASEQAARERQVRFFRECGADSAPGKDAASTPPSYRYMLEMTDRMRNARPEHLSENAVLIGSPERIAATLKRVEAAGFAEVILYFNVGLKPHSQVKDEMARFMAEVAPAFA